MNGPAASADVGAPPPDPAGLPGPGSMLARLRAERRMDLEDVASRLKFGTRQLEALEADDYARLPGMTFVRGMVRSYAKLLDADAQPLLQALERRHAPAPVAVDVPSKRIPFPDGRSRSTRVYLALSAVLVLIVGAVMYEWHFGVPQVLSPAARTEPPQAPAPVTPPSPPPAAAELASPVAAATPAGPVTAAAESTPAPAGAPAGSESLSFFFDEESWVQVKDRSDRVLLSQLNPADSQKIVTGQPPFTLVIGNANHVRLNYRDKTVDLKPHIKVDVARFTLN